MEENAMKKIFLALAAVAALASCVKENTLVPEQTADNLVTITAVSADTKTTLDGENVLWEENDEIAVVVEGESDKYLEKFTTSSTEKASTADFTAVLSNELVADETVTGVGYAVYPAASATYAAGNVSIAHELPEEQTGTITKGMNLSYAKVDADDLKTGKANAVFSNALTLLKVNVPAGVKSVVLESDIMSDALVGTVNFTVNKTADDISFVKDGTVSPKRTLTLSNGGAELEEGVHYLLVFPGTANELTLTMTGTDDAVYESTLNDVEFVAGTYRTINLTKVFKMGVKDVEAVSPMGGTFDYEVVATAQYDYKVAIEGDPTWIRLNENTHVTKAFVGTKVSFEVDANTSGSPREADVTISWNNGEPQSKSFTISQSSAYLDFVYVDGNPANDLIQWEESFGVYSSESDALNGTNATNTYSKKAFNIELSDDPEKGTYMITNMFYADSYFGEGYQMIYSKGAKYYADYADGVLTVKKNDSVNSYYFSDNILLTYDSANKKFTAAPIPTTSSNVWIGGYTVTVKVDDPGAGGDLGDAVKVLGNTYKESYSLSGAYGNTPGNLVFEESDDLSIGNVKITNIFGCQATGMYATVSGNTITTIESAYINNLYGTTPIGQLILTIGDDGNITMSNQPLYNFYYLENYVATKQ